MQKNVLISIGIITLSGLGFWYALHNASNRIVLPTQVVTITDKKTGPMLASKVPLYTFEYVIPTGLPGAEALLATEQEKLATLTDIIPEALLEKIAEYNAQEMPGDEMLDTITVAGLSPNREYIVYLVDAYSYNSGAAHGNTLKIFRVFDKEGNEYRFSDMFADEDRTLSRLSTMSRDVLLADSGKEEFSFERTDDWFLEGTAPDATNFRMKDENEGSFVAPLADGLHILFNQYQIAPYVMGYFEAVAPYQDYPVADIIDPKFTR